MRTSATVTIDLTYMTDSDTIISVARTPSTVSVDLVNETDTVEDIKITIPLINARADPRHEQLLEVIKELFTFPIAMQKYSNPVRCIDK